jgi:hypothetical protein
VPLFVEAITAACDGIADIQGVRDTDPGLDGLLHVLEPDAVIAECLELPTLSTVVPIVHVDLAHRRIALIEAGVVHQTDIEMSGEAIRNVALGALFAAARG